MEQIPALVITYDPAHDLHARLDLLYTQFSQVIVVDNGSKPETRILLEKQVHQRDGSLSVIFNSSNLGVAKALNQGFELAIRSGAYFIITLDQDSIPVSGMKDALLKAYQTHPNRGKLAVLAPDIIEKSLGKPSRYIRKKNYFFFERIVCNGELLRNVSFVITSGSMYNLELYTQIGPFRDDFFVDAVDTEYCLRALSNGYEISVAGQAGLEHHLGNRQRKQFLGKPQNPTFHPPLRWYYISRNRIRMIFLYGWRFPHWLFYEITITITGLIRMLLFETERKTKLKAILLGTWHGLTRKLGEITVETKNSLSTRR